MRPVRQAFLAASLVAACGLVQAKPIEYTILTKISRVSFNLAHQGFIQLFGTLRVAPGTVTFDSEDWSRSHVDVSLPVSSLDMGDSVWNGQIRGDDEWAPLFKTSAITFHSTRLKRVDATHGTMIGDLTLGGITRPVTLKLRVNKIGKNDVLGTPSVGFTATTTIKRSAFGIKAYEDLVGDAISVQIQIEALEGPDPEATLETAPQPAK
jgi:polyisoprenoid-binding protein YceI